MKARATPDPGSFSTTETRVLFADTDQLPVVEAGLTYRRPARYDEVLTVRTALLASDRDFGGTTAQKTGGGDPPAATRRD